MFKAASTPQLNPPNKYALTTIPSSELFEESALFPRGIPASVLEIPFFEIDEPIDPCFSLFLRAGDTTMIVEEQRLCSGNDTSGLTYFILMTFFIVAGAAIIELLLKTCRDYSDQQREQTTDMRVLTAAKTFYPKITANLPIQSKDAHYKECLTAIMTLYLLIKKNEPQQNLVQQAFLTRIKNRFFYSAHHKIDQIQTTLVNLFKAYLANNRISDLRRLNVYERCELALHVATNLFLSVERHLTSYSQLCLMFADAGVNETLETQFKRLSRSNPFNSSIQTQFGITESMYDFTMRLYVKELTYLNILRAFPLEHQSLELLQSIVEDKTPMKSSDLVFRA